MSACAEPNGNRSDSGTGSCCGHETAAEEPVQADERDVAECPVMVGNAVIKSEAEEAGLFRDFQGQRYWLCCDSCGPLFDADPELYVVS